MKLIDHLSNSAKLDMTERPALVVQGGGLRGVYSMGALAMLEDAGLRDSFSFVIGSSAGACNGAKFLCRQANDGIAIYVDELSGPEFVSLRRPLKLVDIDFFVDTALKERHPLDLHELLSCPIPLYTVLTDAETGAEHIVSSHDPALDPYEVIRATAALPGLYNRRVQVGTRHYLDGGIANQVPITEAFTRGARELLVVLTRGRGYRRNGHGLGYRFLSRALARGQSPAIRSRLGTPDPTYNQAMALLEDEHNGPRRRTWSVWPSDRRFLVGRTTTDAAALRACADMGKRDMEALLDEPYRAP